MQSLKYGKEVDVWSTGCVIAEMLTGQPLFPCNSNEEQLDQINSLLDPSNDTMELYFADCDQDAVDLIKQLLVYDQDKRITAEDALKHKYFSR